MRTAVSVDQELGRTLADCALERRSGIVTALRGKHKRLFCLEEGMLAYAASNVIEEQLSELLMRERLLTVGDLAAAQRECDRRGVKLTRLLLSENLVPEERLREILEDHFTDLLFLTLDWNGGRSSYARGHPDLGGEVTARLACVPLLLEYARHRPPSLADVQARIGPPGTRLVRRQGYEAILEEAAPDPTMLQLLDACDGETTVAGLVEGSSGDEETVWRSLYASWLLGLVDRAARPAEELEAVTREEILSRLERAAGADHYGILGVPSTALRSKILEAYFVLARKYHPDRYRTGPLADLREQLESYFARVTEAYNTLYDPRLRRAYDEQLASEATAEPEQDTAYLARENFRRALALVSRGRFTDAVTSMENAIKLDPLNARYRLEAGRLLGRNPRLRDRAEAHLVEVNRIDPSLPDGYYELGELYLKMGRGAEALDLFRETLRWDPDHVDAGARVRELGPR